MATVVESEKKVKKIVKAAILELLEERRDIVRGILAEVFEDSSLFKAIIADDGITPSRVRGSGLKVLENVKKKSSSTKVTSRTVKPRKKTQLSPKSKPRPKPTKSRAR